MIADRDPHDPIGCQWIDGDPRQIEWSYCQRRQRDGSVYCAEHHRRAFKKIETDKQEKAA